MNVKFVKKELLKQAIQQQCDKLERSSGRITREDLNISTGSRSEDDDGHLVVAASLSNHLSATQRDTTRAILSLKELEKQIDQDMPDDCVSCGSLIRAKLNGEIIWLFVLPVCLEDELEHGSLDGEVTVVSELSPVVKAINANPGSSRIRVNSRCEYELLKFF